MALDVHTVQADWVPLWRAPFAFAWGELKQAFEKRFDTGIRLERESGSIRIRLRGRERWQGTGARRPALFSIHLARAQPEPDIKEGKKARTQTAIQRAVHGEWPNGIPISRRLTRAARWQAPVGQREARRGQRDRQP